MALFCGLGLGPIAAQADVETDIIVSTLSTLPGGYEITDSRLALDIHVADVNQNGRLAFAADSGLSATRNFSLFRESGDDQFETIFTVGDTVDNGTAEPEGMVANNTSYVNDFQYLKNGDVYFIAADSTYPSSAIGDRASVFRGGNGELVRLFGVGDRIGDFRVAGKFDRTQNGTDQGEPLMVNEAGVVAVKSDIADINDTLQSSVLRFDDATDALTIEVKEEDSVPGVSGADFSGFIHGAVVLGDGTIGFGAQAGNVSAGGDSVFVTGNGPSRSVRLREGDAAPDIAPTQQLGTVHRVGPTVGGNDYGAKATNSGDMVFINVGLGGQSDALFKVTSDSIDAIAWTDMLTPTFSNAAINNTIIANIYDGHQVNDNGDVAFWLQLADDGSGLSGLTDQNDHMLVVAQAGGLWDVVLREGDIWADDPTKMVRFNTSDSFFLPEIAFADNGDLAFHVNLRALDNTGPYSNAIFARIDGELTKLAIEGETVTDKDTGEQIVITTNQGGLQLVPVSGLDTSRFVMWATADDLGLPASEAAQSFFFVGSATGSGAGASVSEPASAALLLLTTIAAWSRRQRGYARCQPGP